MIEIESLSDVLPSINGRADFVLADRGAYQIVDYAYSLPDSFDDPIRIECRGLKFDAGGRLIARTLHKFFNVGEKVSTQPNALDFTSPHTITEKLDGSMIHPAVVDGELVLMTRMGRSDVAVKAEKRHLDLDLELGLRRLLDEGVTPIFEFTAPDNRIIIKYAESQLSLLAARWTRTGEYLAADELERIARGLGKPLVPYHSSRWSTGVEFIEYARALVGVEGFVVRFESGLWVKAKGEDYALKHKAKESILQEKNVLAMIAGGQLDDVLPLLDAADRAHIEDYRDAVIVGMADRAAIVRRLVDDGAHLDQKAFAVDHLRTTEPSMRPLAFVVRAGADPMDAITKAVLKAASSQTTVDASRHLHGAVWPL